MIRLGLYRDGWRLGELRCSLEFAAFLQKRVDRVNGPWRRRGRLHLYILAWLLSLALTPLSPAWTATYLVQDLGGFLVEDVNRLGRMAGSYCDGTTPCRPATHDGKAVEVIDERPGTAWALNNLGDVAYEAFDEDGPHAIFMAAGDAWRREFRVTSPYTQAVPRAMNDAGQVVGEQRIRGQTGMCPALWHVPDADPLCFTPFASNARAEALNQRGVVEGFWQADESGGSLTFLWSPSTGLIERPFGNPKALNEAGWSVYEHGDLVSPSGVVVPLGVPEGCGNARGADLNNLRVVLGESDCPHETRAWVWVNGAFVDLTAAVGDATYVIRRAKALNDLGQVAAWAEHVPTSLYHGVLLTPAKVAKVLERLGR